MPGHTNIRFVDPAGIESGLRCYVCQLVMRDAAGPRLHVHGQCPPNNVCMCFAALPCQHEFCKDCAHSVCMAGGGVAQCPKCHVRFNGLHELSDAQTTRANVERLLVRCSHSSKGCGWTGPMYALSAHVSSACRRPRRLPRNPPPFTKLLCPASHGAHRLG
jgi:hypothetical protein